MLPHRIWIACLSALMLLTTADHAQGVRPNIVLMMADDMGMGDTSAYRDFTGNSPDDQLHTPNMERLARMGVRFTDAHTPSSRCTSTRYGLLTGRYPWRSRLKHWVLFGSQGDPLIEADRPTLATLLRGEGYATAMVGKWHVGLRYRNASGEPAAGWHDADLTQPLHDTPLDHGFDYARFTSRSHGTSGPDAGKPAARRASENNRGPGHIHGRQVVGATGKGKQLVTEGPQAYVLDKLGSRHSDHAIEYLQAHVTGKQSRQQPFFLYYAANANHGPYTPDESIGGEPVAGAARTTSGRPMDARHDFIYENDVALGRLLDWLAVTDDPRNAGRQLIETTLVIFTSDNGAERNNNVATGPFRSHKGSVFEGGHRVPFLVAWPAGGIGNGEASTPGHTSAQPIGLQDMYATFAELTGASLPRLSQGEKGAEDSQSVLAAMRGDPLPDRPPLLFNDHKEARGDHAVLALRLDSPTIGGEVYAGQWKMFFDAKLLRTGEAEPTTLYNLATDSREQTNLIGNSDLQPLIEHLTKVALLHRTASGHRLVERAGSQRVTLDWRAGAQAGHALAGSFNGQSAAEKSVELESPELVMTISGANDRERKQPAEFHANANGLGISSGRLKSVDAGDALLLRFDRDVIIESVAITAGNGTCGGFYQVGEASPLAIYCLDADNDAQDQSGMISDIGYLPAGVTLRLDSTAHMGSEEAGQWRLTRLVVRKAS